MSELSNFVNSTSSQTAALIKNFTATRPSILKTIPIRKNHEIAKIPSNIYSFKSNELAEKYRVEIGVRTAVILGSMVFFIVLYFLWHSIAKFFTRRLKNKSGSTRKYDYNLDYWLEYIDMRAKRKQQNRQKIVIIYSPKLPELPYDSRLSTRDWVNKHKEVWNNMQSNFQNNSKNKKWYQEAVLFEENYENLINQKYSEINETLYPLEDKEIEKIHLPQNFNYSPTIIRLKSLFRLPFRKTTKHKINYKTVRRSVVYRELETNAQLINNYYKEVLENYSPLLEGFKMIRRRHSWPKCNKDFLKLQSFDLVKTDLV